jgi:hypothetical protein
MKESQKEGKKIMYRRNNTPIIKSSNVSPEIFIEGNDYANSELLYKLDQVDSYSQFMITKNEHRIDLIAEEIYGGHGEDYGWILMYINRVSLNELVRHKILNYIPIKELTAIINSV